MQQGRVHLRRSPTWLGVYHMGEHTTCEVRIPAVLKTDYRRGAGRREGQAVQRNVVEGLRLPSIPSHTYLTSWRKVVRFVTVNGDDIGTESTTEEHRTIWQLLHSMCTTRDMKEHSGMNVRARSPTCLSSYSCTLSAQRTRFSIGSQASSSSVFTIDFSISLRAHLPPHAS